MRKYKLPTSHACFVDRSYAEWVDEMYADLYIEREQAIFAQGDVKNSGLKSEAFTAEVRRLNAEVDRLNQALGDRGEQDTLDPLADAFEDRMAQGESDLNLDALLPKGYVART